MKKSAFPAALLLLVVASSGCPVYDSSDGCLDDLDCYDGYVCERHSGDCVVPTSSTPTCGRPQDCGANETCSRSGSCVAGDCHFESVGCVRGYTCSAPLGRWECVASNADGAGGESGAAGVPNSSAGADDGSTSAGAPAAGGAGG